MEDPYITYFGVSIFTVGGLTVFWAIVFIGLLGNADVIIIPVGIMVFVSIFFINTFGMMLTVFLGVTILILGVYFLLRYADEISSFGRHLSNVSKPTQKFTVSSTTPISAAHTFGIPTNKNYRLPDILYHGTPTLTAAKDIYLNNRWRVSSSSMEHGIFMTEEFKVAARYAKSSGFIVVLKVTLPSSSIVDMSSRGFDNDQALAMGYRLMKMKNIYVALLPKKAIHSQYFRVSGITPVGILDINKNPISITA